MTILSVSLLFPFVFLPREAFQGMGTSNVLERTFQRLNIYWSTVPFKCMPTFCLIQVPFVHHFRSFSVYHPTDSFDDRFQLPIMFLLSNTFVKNLLTHFVKFISSFCLVFNSLLFWYQLVKDRYYFSAQTISAGVMAESAFLFGLNQYTYRNCCNAASMDPTVGFFLEPSWRYPWTLLFDFCF